MMGCRVLTCSRKQDELDECVKDWKSSGYDVTGVKADISTKEGINNLHSEIQEWIGSTGKLDILINNVGTNVRKPSVEYTEEDIETVMKTNFHSMFGLTMKCYPLLKRLPGEISSSVVNIGSVAGVTCIKTGTIYAATKAAMNQIVGNLCCEWGLDGIRVNVSCLKYSSQNFRF
jgi:Tropinone reductase 1